MNMLSLSTLPVSVLAIVSVVGVSLLSLLGIVFFLVEERFVERVLLYFVSFSTGALLGDVFLHMVPDMADDAIFLPKAMIVVLGGILFSFIIEKIVHWRHCHVLEHNHDHDHEHHHPAGILSLVGETIHNFIDGVVIAASFVASPAVGLATTLAVVFHEIPHEIGNYAILLHSGYGKERALLFNFLAACSSIVGAIAVLLVSSSLENVTVYMLPFAAGNLLYIAGSDLIPELHKHTKISQGILQLLCMLIGMVMMYGILFLE
jgi:zinc and cadmium transporter